MLNIDPKFRHLTFHQMDAMNREKMWTAKTNNDLIANKGAETIGLPVQELLAPMQQNYQIGVVIQNQSCAHQSRQLRSLRLWSRQLRSRQLRALQLWSRQRCRERLA
jgi:hypothetical protein